MLSGAYVPRWVDVQFEALGTNVRAITFVITTMRTEWLLRPLSAGRPGRGDRGGRSGRPCADYLINTVDHLAFSSASTTARSSGG